MVDFVAEMAKPCSSAPLLNNWRVSRKGLCHLINVGVGAGNSEVISIGAGEKSVGLEGMWIQIC